MTRPFALVAQWSKSFKYIGRNWTLQLDGFIINLIDQIPVLNSSTKRYLTLPENCVRTNTTKSGQHSLASVNIQFGYHQLSTYAS